MKQLTKKEVVELVAREIRWGLHEMQSSNSTAQIILQALETNGILCLVEGEAKEGDILALNNKSPSLATLFDDCHTYSSTTNKSYLADHDVQRIIQRNSIPAYHCKPETSGAE